MIASCLHAARVYKARVYDVRDVRYKYYRRFCFIRVKFPRFNFVFFPKTGYFGFPERKRREKGIIFEKTLKNLRFGSNGIRARVSNVIIGQ